MSDEALEKFRAGLATIEGEYQPALEAATNENALREARAKFTGPQGALTELMKGMKDVPGKHRRELGQASNALKNAVQALFDARLEAIEKEALRAELEGPMLDLTLPGRRPMPGRLHPVTRAEYDLLDIFGSMGFETARGPEIDTFGRCFSQLGFPPDHPATDEHDTFYVSGGGEGDEAHVLRTHTSTMQIREMSRREPPLAVVSPGKVFRRDDDATHSPMFHQLEGFLVDEGITMAHLQGMLTVFLERFFGTAIDVRFRASYFPFVEPGAELDVRRAAQGDEPAGPWMEILGCGMIHPTVLRNVGYDPEKVSGFAFGMGVDRIAMVRHAIPNIKALYDNDVRFLSAF
ncbi:MAG: phenylalanine--tRNA ligase subunit alpha [Deltaproteobacteria bacterium]|nr:phenylalanine--tRNA ligase subunit alpha [Deltaproteobacteria bacterium]